MNTFNEDNLPLHYVIGNTWVKLTLLYASFLQERPSNPHTPLSTRLSESVHRTLEPDDLIAHVPATGRKLLVHSFIQVCLDKCLLYV